MFQRLFGREKKSPNTDKTEEGNSTPSPRRIAWAEVPDHKSPDKDHKGTSWLLKLFGRSVNKDNKSATSCSNEPPATTTTAGELHPEQEKTKKKKKKRSVWRKLLNCCKKKNRVSPSPPIDEEVKVSTETETERKQEQKKDQKDQKDEQPIPSISQDQAAPQTLVKQGPSSNSTKGRHVQFEASTQPQRHPQRSHGRLSGGQRDWFGFPNPNQICYLNSSLHSLITLVDFIRDITSQEEVWSVAPGADVIGALMNIVQIRRSMDPQLKLVALMSFKRAISDQAPEFQDNQQKDAHEFLTTVLHQIRNLLPVLQDVAAILGREYKCPVQEHLVFNMYNTRTCKSCGGQSTREEEFTNLSLTLQPGSSVQDMLQDYLTETDLDFRCDCGANTSGQQSSFMTLPKVLILHLKRFCFNHYWQLQKLNSSVQILKELLVTSSQGDGRYSLVSIISHLGFHGNFGHYICDGVHPGADIDDLADPADPADRWLTYDDMYVGETTGAAACEGRRRTAYILVYRRQA